MSTGGILSIAGRGAHGDFAGVADAGFETSVGFSAGAFSTRGDPGFAWRERGLSTVAFGPTDVVGFFSAAAFASFAFFSSSSRILAAASAACCSASNAAESFWESFILVPSFHSIVSGAQSSSSSSISAHLASLPSPSACILVARWIPYCCLSSSSVRCLRGC